MIWKPHLTVAAVIEKAGRFLLVQEQIAGQSVYNQPAGHLEDNESLVDAVVRETLEETAWHIKPEAIIGIYRWRHPDRQDTFVRVSFKGQGLYHDPDRELDSGIERALWLTAEEIRQQQDRLRSPMVMRSIDDYLSGKAWPLTLWTEIENH
ncbi:MAG: NUDIX hydrolase [Gammaproteobacteria bacterium]|nr:NUDIX hydrolase [Zetaproteobacteria bacterium]MCK5479689.1 NUDIX hydrolase [Gammaproteobacteria bacterium]